MPSPLYEEIEALRQQVRTIHAWLAAIAIGSALGFALVLALEGC